MKWLRYALLERFQITLDIMDIFWNHTLKTICVQGKILKKK